MTNSHYLLVQDDTIPGNAKNGFRFNYLIFALIATPIYLWLELAFGIRLLDSISAYTTQEEIDSMEHWGRLISGLAVSLLFLTSWFEMGEKWGRTWTLRIVGAIVICAIAIPLTWMTQTKVIDFYVEHGSTELTYAIPILCVILFIGMLFMSWIIKRVSNNFASPIKNILLVLACGGMFLLTFVGAMKIIPPVIEYFFTKELLTARLGIERQQAATLSIIKKALQSKIYTLNHGSSKDMIEAITGSPEGKAAITLFPVIGASMDQGRFVADRSRVLKELMYLEWDKEMGEQAYNGYLEVMVNLRFQYENVYVRHDKPWDEVSKIAFDRVIPQGMTKEEFYNSPEVAKLIRSRIGCFDCQFTTEMPRDDFTYELFINTQMSKVTEMLSSLEDPVHFQDSEDGEKAARLYWVPIWALLFSMIGAFTHIFKITFFLSEYVIFRAFSKVHAADSPLAHLIVTKAKHLLMVLTVGIIFFVYFSENRISSDAGYKMVHRAMLKNDPIVGGIATHWTINAQALIYPFVKTFTPEWLSYKSDPFDNFPLLVLRPLVIKDDF